MAYDLAILLPCISPRETHTSVHIEVRTGMFPAEFCERRKHCNPVSINRKMTKENILHPYVESMS